MTVSNAPPGAAADIDEGARRRFEEAWRHGPPPLAAFLPDESDPRYGATLEELVLIDIELAAKSGEARRLSDYLDRYPTLAEPDRAGRLRDALEEVAVSAPQGLRPGQSLGRYTLIAEHGRGAFGAVWRALDPQLGREVALKVLHRQGDPAARARFLGEARLAAGLEHPGIVPIHEIAGDDGPVPFFTMKLLRGRTFADVVRDLHAGGRVDRVAERRGIEAVLAVARAVDFAHDRGVIHRDLKPANILIGDYGETVVLDWGIGKRLDVDDPLVQAPDEPLSAHHAPAARLVPASEDALTVDGTLLGTPAYMAPEQARGRVGDTDARTDVFALGAILYEVLTGRIARTGSSQTELIEAASRSEVPPPSARAIRPGVARALDGIGQKAMASSAEARYPNAGAFAADLERFLADEPVSAIDEAALERVGRSIRRHRTAWAAGGVAMLFLVVGAIVASQLWQRGELVRERADAERRSALLQRAAQVETWVRGEAAARRYADTDPQFTELLSAVRDEPSMGRLAERLSGLADRLARLSRFERLGDDARFLSGEERYLECIRAAEGALDAVGADREAWWTTIPTEDLPADRRTEVVGAVHRLWLLVASARVNRALAVGTPEAVASLCPGAVHAVRRAAAYEPSLFGRLVHATCGSLGVDAGPVPPIPSRRTGADAFFLGLLHLWLDQFPSSKVAQLLPVFRAAVPGLDLEHSRETAIRLLTDAVRLDPTGYWPPFLLGWALTAADDYRGAELAFDLALQIRPDYPRALEGRGRAIMMDAQARKDEARVVVANADFDRALALAPTDPWTWWGRASTLEQMGKRAEAVAARRRAFTLDAAALYRVIHGAPVEELSAQQGPNQALRASTARLQAEPGDRQSREEKAAAHLCLGEDVEAARLLSAHPPSDAFGELLRGVVALRAGRHADAADAFETAARHDPALFLAHVGRALALERAGKLAEREFAVQRAVATAENDWQRDAARRLREQ